MGYYSPRITLKGLPLCVERFAFVEEAGQAATSCGVECV